MINTMKDVAVVQAILVAVSDPRFTLRSVACLAQAAHTDEAKVVEIAHGLGLVQKRRRSDGAALFGIEERLNAPRAAAPVATPVRDERYETAKARVSEALHDERWTMRTESRIDLILGADVSMKERILRELGAERMAERFIGLSSRN